MIEPQAYLAGRYLPLSQAAVSIADTGFMLGVTATEQLRTFGGRLFRLDEHLQRLENSLRILRLDPGLSLTEIGRIATELSAANFRLLKPGDDLGVGLFVTPGPSGTLTGVAPPGPLVGIYSFPLPFANWAELYERGQALRQTSVQQVSEQCWPRALKVRSRVHYYLADHEAAAAEPGARAVLLDQDGSLTEATTANLVLYSARHGLRTPPAAKVLPGITLAVIAELAAQLALPFRAENLTPADLSTAEEAFLCSTSGCILPAVRFDGRPIGTGAPGPIFRRLLAAWNALVGFDLVAQAKRFKQR